MTTLFANFVLTVEPCAMIRRVFKNIYNNFMNFQLLQALRSIKSHQWRQHPANHWMFFYSIQRFVEVNLLDYVLEKERGINHLKKTLSAKNTKVLIWHCHEVGWAAGSNQRQDDAIRWVTNAISLQNRFVLWTVSQHWHKADETFHTSIASRTGWLLNQISQLDIKRLTVFDVLLDLLFHWS